MAVKQGFGLPVPPPRPGRGFRSNCRLANQGRPHHCVGGRVPWPLTRAPGRDPVQAHLSAVLASMFTTCNYARQGGVKLRFAVLALGMLAEPDKRQG